MVGARLPSTWAGWGWALVIGFGNVTVTLAGIAEGTRLAGAAVASVLLNSARSSPPCPACSWARADDCV
jgi:hypothetical protein